MKRAGDAIEWHRRPNYKNGNYVNLSNYEISGGIANSIVSVLSGKPHPDAIIVEYYFSGFEEQYQGMDWQTLRLVFEELDNIWYLVGIIHNQWASLSQMAAGQKSQARWGQRFSPGEKTIRTD